MRYLMTFSYDGSKYNGYQTQPHKNTVQNEIEDVLSKICQKKISIHASGRTDSGVHALNQKCHFDCDLVIDFKKALNSLLSDNIYIKEVKTVDQNFHARYDVSSKEYVYIINVGEYNVFEKDYVLQYNRKLNVSKMKKGLKYFNGTHDFKSFTKVEFEKDFVRTIYKTKLVLKNDKIYISFKGNGFLRYQIRNMIGTLIEIGEGKKEPNDIKEILLSKDRKKAGINIKSNGLYLKDVWY